MTEVLLFVARNCPDALKYLGKQDEVLSYVKHLKAQKTLPITKADAKDINKVLESLGCTDELIKYGDDVGIRPSLLDDVGGSGSVSWVRNLNNTSDLNIDDFMALKDNGIVKVNASGSDRPLIGEPNSYYKTGNGEHIFVYDEDGKLIYDISSSRVKGFKINIDPNGGEHYQPYKLQGAVPDAIKELFGW